MDQKVIGMAVVVAAVAIAGAIIWGFGGKNAGSGLAKVGTAITPQTVLAEVNAGTATLIDVRTDDEWNAGHAAGAVHFDVARMQNGELPSLPKDSAIYLYCRTGHRAGIAQEILQQNGFMSVTNLGGLSAWQAQGGPLAH